MLHLQSYAWKGVSSRIAHFMLFPTAQKGKEARMMAHSTEAVKILLILAAVVSLTSAIRIWAGSGRMKRTMIATYLVGAFVFGAAGAFASPSGEADTTFRDDQRTVLSVAITAESGGTYYNLLLAKDRVEDARYHKLSADMLTVIGIPKDTNCRTFTVRSKQGLRTATLDCSVMVGG